MLTLLFVVLINGFLGLLIFSRNSNSLINRLFFAFTTGTLLWALSSYLTDHAPLHQRLLWGRLAFVFPVVITFILTLLSRCFPVQLKTPLKSIYALSLLATTSIIMCLTPFVVKNAHFDSNGTTLLPGSLYFAFIVMELILFSYCIKSYVQGRAVANTDQRQQAKIVGFGIVCSFLWALILNVLLPLIANTLNPAQYGPVGSVIFVSFTAYAIVKHRLFDIKAVIARSIGYILTIASISTIFVAFSFFAINRIILNNNQLPLKEQLIYTLMAVLLAFAFPVLKLFFDKRTEKLFYRDAYDSQEFLGNFNKALVSTFEVTPLLKKSTQMIESYIKPSYIIFGLRRTGTNTQRIIGTSSHPQFGEEEIRTVNSLTSNMHQIIIVTDQLEQKHATLKTMLQSKDIAVLARLASNSNEDGIGYLILGSKKSGNLYSQQDLKNIAIIADELVIAILNALRTEEIQNFNLTLQAKVDEATRKLRDINEKLKALDESKDDFISMASHQLRTPLTSVKGYLSLVLEGDAGKVTKLQKEMLDQAFTSSQRMVYLIADLLNVSRIKTGKFIIESRPVDLSKLVSEELLQLSSTIKSHALTLDYRPPASFPILALDETKIRQVVMNFADNAIYYTPPGGKVKIELIDKPSSVEFRVVDNGLGVPKAEQPHLFTKFYRAANARKARPDGTGLGLFMAKKVIVAQGGALIFNSVEGKGSTFGFSFSKADLAKSSVPAIVK